MAASSGTTETQTDSDSQTRDLGASWLLTGIAYWLRKEALWLPLRGGAALRHLYFADARLSPDLDLALPEEVSAGDLFSLVDRACRDAERASGIAYEIMGSQHNPTVRLGALAHAWRIAFRLPASAHPAQSRIQVSFGRAVVLDGPVQLPLIRRYDGLPEVRVSAYTLEELLAEKLLALVPGRKVLRPYAVRRKYARHLYDIQFAAKRADLDLAQLARLFQAKCSQHGVLFEGSDLFVDEFHMSAYRAGWAGLAAIVVGQWPTLEQVLKDFQSLTIKSLPSEHREEKQGTGNQKVLQ